MMSSHKLLARTQQFFKELWIFTFKQASACIFGASLLLIIIITNWIDFSSFFITRYDFIFIAAISLQAVLIVTKLESWKEVKVIFIFHFLAVCMELFKTHPSVGSWQYPGNHGIFMIGTVPLFTGFLYSSVGSYIARSWKIFKLSFTNFPKLLHISILSAAIYINFFTHHFFVDIRIFLFIISTLLFWKTRVYFTMVKTPRSMPLLLSFLLIASFLYIAENIGTYTKIWLYPSQISTWSIVPIEKYGAWFLLIIISFTLVALIYKKTLNSHS